jgi:RNA polymerase sigma-70 factor, ECF subfamily
MMWFAPRSSAAAALPADDAALVRRIAAGDRRALEAAYALHAPAVYRYLLALGASAAAASDATQEAFVVLAERPAGFDAQRGRLPAWLAGVARHALLLHWRTQQREVGQGGLGGSELADDDAAVGSPTAGAAGADGPSASPETLLVQRQSAAAVWAAIRRLPLSQREALVLVDIQERPYADAAQIAGIDIDVLRTRLHRARQRLAELLRAAPGLQGGW